MYRFTPTSVSKLLALRARGVDPYPNGFVVTHTSEALHRAFTDGVDLSLPEGQGIAIGGRLVALNVMGKAMFLRVQDSGGVLQVYVKRDDVGEEAYALLKKLDIGDIVWARGDLMRTRAGELTLRAQEARLAAKNLNPFPDRWNGVADVQLRARQRYVDLFMNEPTRDTFRKRSRVVRYIRDFFEDREFLEVETPMLQSIPGGATARPFVTHHNALDIDLYLRIAPELYLKRLVVGGFERVFEINRNFRNEGLSVRHNPEFTMIEFYQAWATHEDLMALTETLLSGLAEAIVGSTQVPFDGRTLDFSAPFRRADMDALIVEHTSLSREDLWDVEAMRRFWVDFHGETEGMPTTVGKWWEWLFEAHVEDQLGNPTFVTGFPAEISPLSRRSDADPFRVERFELIVNGWELANGFSELNDPIDQAERFATQVEARAAGDDEGMFFDADYIRALSYGMPPTAGEGIGIDRLVMLLTGQTSIREVILFPTLRPEAKAG